METADILTMVLLGLILVVCWAVVPGLIAGWLLREGGRRFKWGFAFSAVFGPFAVLAALLFIFLAGRISSARTHRRTHPMHYDVPVLGHLHASTAWILAGLATFLCMWMLGGIGFEVFYHRPPGDDGQRVFGLARKVTAPMQAPQSESQANTTLPASKPAAVVKSDEAPSQPPRSSVLGAITSQPAQPGQLAASASPVTTLPDQSTSPARVELTSTAPSPQPTSTSQVNSSAPQGNVAVAPPKPPTVGRAAVISELTSSLSARGYKAHATVSGDSRTSTLSISCATLTRSAGNQILGNSRMREALKATGIRIVVMINGQESWTYML